MLAKLCVDAACTPLHTTCRAATLAYALPLNGVRSAATMRQSLTWLLVSSAAAFAPTGKPRAAVKLHSSVKPSAGISFYDGLYEPDVPDVKLTRCRCSVLQNVTTPSTRNVVTNTLIHAVAAQVQGRRERRRDLQF